MNDSIFLMFIQTLEFTAAVEINSCGTWRCLLPIIQLNLFSNILKVKDKCREYWISSPVFGARIKNIYGARFKKL